MSVSNAFLKKFEKMTKEKQKEYMSTRGDYAHMDKRVLEIELTKALKNIKHAKPRRITKSDQEINTSDDRSGGESSNIKG